MMTPLRQPLKKSLVRRLPARMLLPCLLAAIFLSPLLPACTETPKGKAADGKRWYGLHRCSGCHGEGGRGGKGPVLAGTDLSFRRFLGKLRAPNSAIMPAYAAEQLPDQDAADIYLFLQSPQK
jgi:mono/diheme cytochrome c family protein